MDHRELLRRLGVAGSSPQAPSGWLIKCPIHPEVQATVTQLETAECPEGCTYENYVEYVHGLYDEKLRDAAASLPPVPVEVYAEGIQRAFLRAHENTGAPLAYFVLGALAPASTALGASTKVYVNPGWLERACFHVALMGPSGQGKDPAINMLIRPLEIQEMKYNEGNRRAMEQWEQADKKTRGPMPKQNELLQKDATTEATGESLEANPEGILMYDGELVGLVKSIGQYKSGGGGNDRQTFLNYWPGTMSKYKRKGKMALIIPNPTVNVLGGLQDKLFSALGGDDGFRARFLFAVGERRKADKFFRAPAIKSVAIVSSESEYSEWTQAINKLVSRRVKTEPLICVLTSEAQELVEPFLLKLDNELGVGDSEIAEMYRKMKGHIFRVALVLHALDCAESGEAMGEIGIDVLERTLTLVAWCIKAATVVLNTDDGSSPADRDKWVRWEKLGVSIEKQRSKAGTVSAIWISRSGPRWARTDRRQLADALDALGYDSKINKRVFA